MLPIGAKCVRGETDRLNSPCVSGPVDRAGRKSFASDLKILLQLLPFLPDSFVARHGRAGAES